MPGGGETRLIRRLVLTPANINETTIADALVCGDERAVYADKAYARRHGELRVAADQRPHYAQELVRAVVARFPEAHNAAPERSEGARNPYSQAVVMDSGLAPPISGLPEIGALRSPSRLKPTWVARRNDSQPNDAMTTSRMES